MTPISWLCFLLIGSHLHLETAGENSACRLPRGPSTRLYCPVECRRCYGFDGAGCHLPPGSEVTQAVTRVECAHGYRLEKDDDFVLVGCTNGNWTGEFPRCLAQCPPLESDSVWVRCQLGGREVDCGRPTMPQTRATLECRRPSHVEYPNLVEAGAYNRTLVCRYDGRWSHGLPECKPVCGLSKGSAVVEATIKDGLPTRLGVFPWHAGLYTREDGGWKYICGGSLITKHIVLTAAHCVIIDEKNLRVTFAKIQRPWEHDEPETVKRSVSNIAIPREFSSGANTLAWDIALLLLSEPVQINTNVMPVCRDVSLNVDVAQDSNGYVVGWGSSGADQEQETDVLQHNDVSIKLYDECSREIPRLLAVDKFCGSMAKAEGPSESVAQHGDSGGGLTAVYNHQHYILGIVSLKHNDISVFTNVSWFPHRHWMEREMNNLLLDTSSCPASSFQCGSMGACLDSSARCNGTPDCPDASDEDGCPSKGSKPDIVLPELHPDPASPCLTSIEPAKPHRPIRPYHNHLQFSAKLLHTIYSSKPEANLLFSPMAVYGALLLAYLVSYNRTEMNLKQALFLPPEWSKSDVLSTYLDLQRDRRYQYRANVSDSYQLIIAHHMFTARSFHIRDCITELLSRDDLEQIDFDKNPTSHINRWMADNTNGRVEQLAHMGDLGPNSKIVLASAAYHRGSCRSTFQPAMTQKESFFESTTKRHLVSMMRRTGTFNYLVSESLQSHIIQLPLVSNNSISMFVFLPPFALASGISNVIKQMTHDNLRDIFAGNLLKRREVEVGIPRFSFSNTLDLAPAMSAMGVGDLFNSSADLRTLTGQPDVWLDEAIHAAGIEVGEPDSDASSPSSSARSSTPSHPTMFICNHPFVYLIYDALSRSILLAGVYNSPAAN